MIQYVITVRTVRCCNKFLMVESAPLIQRNVDLRSIPSASSYMCMYWGFMSPGKSQQRCNSNVCGTAVSKCAIAFSLHF